MCGIAGSYNRKLEPSPDEEMIKRILESIRYRGPDHLGVFLDGEIVMGCVRLSIQDARERANQPIFNEDGSIAVVYNGEIYNYPELKRDLEAKGHIFRTQVDTEVLVHLYEDKGYGLADALNGMFAFALFDRKKRELILGRDRTGQKPLYVYRNSKGILFCSELKAILPYLDNRKINTQALSNYLSLGYALEPETIIEGVETIDPGSILIINGSAEKKISYWFPNFELQTKITNQNQWEEEANNVLRRSVKRHMLSDVPITLFLSGGVDSSLITQYAVENGGIRKAYTGSFVDDWDYDEYSSARDIGRISGLEVDRVELNRRIIAESVEPLISESALPPGDTSTPATYCLAKQVSKEFRVVLGGDGGDELFGGYPTYILSDIMHKYGWLPSVAIKLAHHVANIFSNRERYMSLPFKLQQLSLAWGLPICDAHFQIKNFFPQQLAGIFLKNDILNTRKYIAETPKAFHAIFEKTGSSNDITKQQWLDFGTFLLSGTIPKMERQCMTFSLENRLPYLDNEVIDLSMRTDTNLMISGRTTKQCMRKLLKKKLGYRANVSSKKRGFTPPIKSLLSRELSVWRNAWLNQPSEYFAENTMEILNHWSNKGWDLHRLEWHICTLKHWCYVNRVD